MFGCKPCVTAQPILAGIELMPMRRRGQLESGREQGQTLAEQFYSLAAS
jgi:hypothetical protein